MRLNKLLERVSYRCLQGNPDIEITSLIYDSRKAGAGSAFVCIEGARNDGHDHIYEVAEKGAAAVVVQREREYPEGITVILAEDTRETLAFMSAAYFGYPAESLKTIGITGTKGKTTTAYMVHAILEKTGIRAGLIGTIEAIIGDERIPADNTTPESYQVQEYFRRMLDKGCSCVVMEVSSQALMQKRVSGFTYDYGVFTNIEPDHIGKDEHKDFADYMECKGRLFKNCRLGIVNADDRYLDEVLVGHTCGLETFGLSEDADMQASDINLHAKEGSLGISYMLREKASDTVWPIEVNIPGAFSVYNSLTAIATVRHFDISYETIMEVMKLVSVKGRVEPVRVSDRFSLMIDYAHNAMSLKSLLTTLREYHPARLVCLFGCGGNRSKDRRFEMGELASDMADFTIVTSDNPRYEEPQVIIEDILVGVRRGRGEYIAICDRKEAIRYSIENARDGDLIVLAGKGHEDYQEIEGVKHHMDERDLIKEILEEMSEETAKARGILCRER